MRILILTVALLMTCAEPVTYECEGWEKRACVCPDGSEGIQRCSRGAAFADKAKARTWQFCSCCFDTKEDQYGVYRYDANPGSGCWDDVYDPSENDVEEAP